MATMKKGGSLGRSEKQMGLNVKSKSHGDINPAGFRKAELKRDGDLIGKRSGEQAPVAKDGKWIQKAINPKHKGFCTPMTKATCTPRRKALAVTLKKMAKKK